MFWCRLAFGLALVLAPLRAEAVCLLADPLSNQYPFSPDCPLPAANLNAAIAARLLAPNPPTATVAGYNGTALTAPSAATVREFLGLAVGTPWTTLGVVADGVTDNTVALNALPSGVLIDGDCGDEGIIKVAGVWHLHSNLNIKMRSGCRIVSYVTGSGSFAIEQADLTVPLTGVTLDGLTISKDAIRAGERILRVYADNFKLLNWTFTTHAGSMFIRGSCQEIAYGKAYDTDDLVGSPGIRHIGNVPKVASCEGQPADVWVHHNNMLSGDAVYQACQPLTTSLWTNISTDDILYEYNVGSAATSAFALIGGTWPNTVDVAFTNYTCENVVYNNNVGSGANNGVLISANSSTVVSKVRYSNQNLTGLGDETNSASMLIRAKAGGQINDVTIKNVNLLNTNVGSFTASGTTGGTISNLKVHDSEMDTPSSTSSGGGYQANVALYNVTDVLFQNNLIHGAHEGAVATFFVGQDDNVADPRTVTNITLLGNVFDNIPDTSIAVDLRNVATPKVTGNSFRKAAGATATTGIRVHNADAIGPGTTDVAISGNDLTGLATPIQWTCNGGTTNVAQYNLGDAGQTCP